jgi:molecular chaperone GrpE
VANEETTPQEEPGVEMRPEGDESEAKIAQLTDDLAKAKDALLRTAADFDNFRKRQRREMDDMKKFAAEKVLLELLPALDNLQRALAAAGQPNAESQSLVQGVKMVAEQFRTALENQGLKGYDSVGQKFDPQRHEAISEREQAGVAPGTVVEEFQRGYTLYDRVARPAMVVVAKGGEAPKDGAKQEEENLN